MAARVVVRRDEGSDGARIRRGGRPSALLKALGLAFVLIGLADVALLWFPTRFESVAWEFHTLSQTLSGLPMAVLGLGLLSYGMVRAPTRAGRLGLSAVLLIAALALIGAAALYATVVPSIVSQTPPEAMLGVRRAVIKDGVGAVVYPILLLYMAVRVWRSAPEGG